MKRKVINNQLNELEKAFNSKSGRSNQVKDKSLLVIKGVVNQDKKAKKSTKELKKGSVIS